jgi:hypothetical protein
MYTNKRNTAQMTRLEGYTVQMLSHNTAHAYLKLQYYCNTTSQTS